MPPPSNPFVGMQAAQQLLQGMNTMQMQMGLMPGGGQQQMQQGPTTAQFSSQINMQYSPQPQRGMQQQMGSMTPVRQPTWFEQARSFPAVNLPPPRFGSGLMMNRQRAQQSTNEDLAMAQGMMGVGARGIGAMASFPIGGGLGSLAYEHLGIGNKMQQMGGALMSPIIDARTRALELQNTSNRFVRGGSDLSASGMGMSMGSSMRLERGLMGMADSSQFQRQTGGMFNRQDVMKITRLAGDMGMLDQSQTADDIKNSVGKISRALSNFMKIAEEPDVKEAMRMMGQMRSMGMTVGETSMAARNARTFSRMAGTDVQTTMRAGMQGAGVYQAAGFTGATGMTAGMAAHGMAAQAAPMLNPRLKALLGGQEGMANLLTQGAAQAGQIDAILPALLTRKNGELTVDQTMLKRVMSGGMSIAELTRRSGENIQRLGGARFLQEFSTRGGELRDQANASFGGMGQIMLPMMLARSIQQQVPGMSFGAALRVTGMNEQQARAYEVMQQDPRFRENMMQQFRADVREQRGERARAREDLEKYNRTPEVVRNLERRVERGMNAFSNRVNDLQISLFGEDQDALEAAGAGTGDLLRTTRADPLSTDVQRAHLRDRMRRGTSLQTLMREADPIRSGVAESVANERQEATRQAGVSGVSGLLTRQFMGPNGFALTAAGRGGMTQRDVVESNRGLVNRAATGLNQFFGIDRTSTAQISREAGMLERTGSGLESAMAVTGVDALKQGRGLRAQGSALGISNDVMDKAMGAATSAINTYAGEQTGPFGLDTGQVTEQGVLSRTRRALISSGVTESQADEMLKGGMQSAIVQRAVRSGSATRSSGAEESINRAINAGGQSSEVGRQERVKATREQTTQIREGALKGLGLDVEGGFMGFGAATKDTQRRVLNVLGGEGEDADIRRLLLAKKAAEANGDDETVAKVERELAKFPDEKVAELESSVAGQLSEVDKEDLGAIGKSLAGKSGEDIVKQLRAAGEEVNKAASGDLDRGLTETLGEEAAAQLRKGGMSGLKEYLKAGGKTNLSREQAAKVVSGRTSEAQLGNRALARAGAGTDAAGALGLAPEAEAAAAQGAEDVISEVAEGGGPGAAFGTAVSEFSEATKMLKEAADEFKGAKELIGIAGAVRDSGSTGGFWNDIFGGS